MTSSPLEIRHQALSRQRDVLAGRLESAQAERARLEEEMHAYGAQSLDELRVKVTEAEAEEARLEVEAAKALDAVAVALA